MKWTTNIPKEAGWYWCRRTPEDYAILFTQIIYVWREHTNELWANVGLEESPCPVRELKRYEWAGPIKKPEEK